MNNDNSKSIKPGYLHKHDEFPALIRLWQIHNKRNNRVLGGMTLSECIKLGLELANLTPDETNISIIAMNCGQLGSHQNFAFTITFAIGLHR